MKTPSSTQPKCLDHQTTVLESLLDSCLFSSQSEHDAKAEAILWMKTCDSTE